MLKELFEKARQIKAEIAKMNLLDEYSRPCTRSVQIDLRLMRQYIAQRQDDATYSIVSRDEKSTMTGIRFSEKKIADKLSYPDMLKTLEKLDSELLEDYINFA